MVGSVSKIVKENTLALLLSAVLSIFAGMFLQMNLERMVMLPAVLALIPPINGMAGNVGSILGARLGSALHLGIVKPALKKQRALGERMLDSVKSGITSFFVISVVVGGWAWARGLANPVAFAATFFLTGLILIPLVILSSTFIAIFSYMRGLDPDNIVGPLLTSIADILGVLSFLLAQTIVLF